MPAHPLELSLERSGAHGGHLHAEDRLHRGPDLDLVGVGADAEGHRVLLFLLPHALFGHEWPKDHLPWIAGHADSASSSARSASRSNTTRRARTSWYTDTWEGGSTVSQGTFRAARANASSRWATTSSVETGSTRRPRAFPRGSWSCRRQRPDPRSRSSRRHRSWPPPPSATLRAACSAADPARSFAAWDRTACRRLSTASRGSSPAGRAQSPSAS